MSKLTKEKLAKRIKIFADGIDPDSIDSMINDYHVVGFTTNPSLMAKLGVKDYKIFAQDMLSRAKDFPVSFEVIADEITEMKTQAKIISAWGENAYVKIPITNTKGITTYDLIKDLGEEGIKLNITAVFTKEQMDGLESYLPKDTSSFVSVFAGRIADAGYNPSEYVKYAVSKFSEQKNVEVLWASTRELYNIIQAIDSKAHVITITKEIIKKLDYVGKNLSEFSIDTIKMFRDDAIKSGFSI